MKSCKERLWQNKEWLCYQYITLDKTSMQIAKECECAQSTIQHWLKVLEIKKEIKHHARYTPLKQYEQYDYLYHQHIVLGKTMTEIAKSINVSSDTIRLNLLRNNIPIHKNRRNEKFSEEQLNDIKTLYQNGESANQIAKIFHTDHQTSYHTLSSNSSRNLSRTSRI